MSDKLIYWILVVGLSLFAWPLVLFDIQSEGFVFKIRWFKFMLLIPYFILLIVITIPAYREQWHKLVISLDKVYYRLFAHRRVFKMKKYFKVIPPLPEYSAMRLGPDFYHNANWQLPQIVLKPRYISMEHENLIKIERFKKK